MILPLPPRCAGVTGSVTLSDDAATGRSGLTEVRVSKSIEDRFWLKVNKTDSCWEWTAFLYNGYGRFSVAHRKSIPAHRFAYESVVGPIPDGLTLDHLCRNRACVNPAHLEPVTMRVNTLRGIGPSAQNAVKTHCGAGHELTGDNVSVSANGWRRCRVCQRALTKAYDQRYPSARRERKARLRAATTNEGGQS